MQLVLGTHRLTPATLSITIDAAIDVGYTRIDTAASYRIEPDVGRALKAWLVPLPDDIRENGPTNEESDMDSLTIHKDNENTRHVKGTPRSRPLSRSEIDITSKLPPKSMSSYQTAYDAGLASLENIFPASVYTDDTTSSRYLDSLLIHWPAKSGTAQTDPSHAVARKETYRALLTLKQKGYVRRPGVSNFTVGHLQGLLDSGYSSSVERPAANQVELHPGIYQTQLPLIEFCSKLGIEVQAYSAVGCGNLLSDPFIVELADKVSRRLGTDDPMELVGRDADARLITRVNPAQLLLKWSLQKGFVPIAKSACPERVKENWVAVNEAWKLDSEEMAELDSFEARFGSKKYCWDPSIVL